MVWLQDQKTGSFMGIMKCASLYSMPKLLACCEYNVAISAVDTLDSELRERCASEPLLACSWARIAKAFAITIYRVNGPTVTQSCEIQPCTCKCCQHSKSSDAAGCKCVRYMVTTHVTRKLVPSPREFLKMAAAAERPK